MSDPASWQVPFLGVVVEGPEACWLLFEFMPGGTLAAWLAAARTGTGGSRRPFLERVTHGLEVRVGEGDGEGVSLSPVAEGQRFVCGAP